MTDLTKKMGDIAKMSTSQILDLPRVKENFIKFSTDKVNAEAEFEKEKMFISLQIAKNKKLIDESDKFTLYSAILSGLATGLSFNPKLALCYLSVRKGVVTYETTATGKLDLLIMSGACQYIRTLECVFDGDEFETNIGEVIKWNRKPERKAGASPYAVFGIFALPNGAMAHRIVYKDKIDVIKKKSTDSWNLWKPGSDFETEMWKKTLLNQAYKTFKKTKDVSAGFADDQDVLATEVHVSPPVNHATPQPYSTEEPETQDTSQQDDAPF